MRAPTFTIPDRRSTFLAGAAIGFGIMIAGKAHAAGTGMPWEQPLQQVLDSVQGPVAKIIAVIIIIVTGLTLAFGETAGGFRRLDRKSKRLNPVTNAHLVCRLLLEKKKN